MSLDDTMIIDISGTVHHCNNLSHPLHTSSEPLGDDSLGHVLGNGSLQVLSGQALLQLQALPNVHRAVREHAETVPHDQWIRNRN